MGPRLAGRIESMAFQGYGVLRQRAKVIFVPFTVTGDEVEVEVTEERKNYALGSLTRIVDPSPWRVDPRCPYFGRCGGCQWQHIDYLFQTESKRLILMDVLGRLGGLKEFPSVTVIPSKNPYQYRVRTQLKVEGGVVGYYQGRSHRLIAIDCCSIAHPLVNETLTAVRQDLPFLELLTEVEINASPEEERSVLLLSARRLLKETERHETRRFLQRHSTLKGIVWVAEGRSLTFGNTALNFTVSFERNGRQRSLHLRASPGAFFQVNLEQNQRLVQTVLDLSDVTGNEELWDLYSGIGNFSLPLATVCREALGIEENPVAVSDARWNARANGISRCRFICEKVENWLAAAQGSWPDVVVLDPPRTGCKALAIHANRLSPKRAIYVSCNPTTLARDLHAFSEKHFLLTHLRLLDLFPQSYHMEVVALLKSPCSRDTQ